MKLDLKLLQTVIQLKVMKLYYHNAHNLAYGPAFTSDHADFAAYYAEVELNYDALVEYFIAEFGSDQFVTADIIKLVSDKLQDYRVEELSPNVMFVMGLALEQELQALLTEIDSKATNVGLKNLVGTISELANIRMYKISRRIRESGSNE